MTFFVICANLTTRSKRNEDCTNNIMKELGNHKKKEKGQYIERNIS